ncbi:MAG: prepilin-type N-terminal cleavage/methylation domain-containing protein [Nostoc sp. JL31]|uniref:type IV pilin-like G/H family protein n=1 Tax=Nostoc sp. JL31 TaxID=2815395 RepID=UPI0025CE2760|nr:type IV pilin-like G/H family protein [Nostoc sp. JL31]MBN3889214.1 prepilin-type N-terminal cleavage/methylation domain-containing protein [Nostoc sp. JL31]
MKTELKAKFIQHILAKKKGDEGFTLIELLVVIIIIGILSAIALPSFLNQANKAKQSEAKTYIGTMNRAQQAFYLEQNRFASQADFGSLGLGIATQTTNYVYSIAGGGGTATIVTNQAATAGGATVPLRSYIGGVGVVTQSGTSEATTIALLCEANAARVNGGADVSAMTGVSSCPTNFSSLSK